ncbi:MAG: hypothetical protein O7G83_16710, partial [Proteobacteria bacterium]|nr:hypothetical protein [Pseudomonadota bacterium]
PIDIVDEYEGLPRSFMANYRTYVDARELIRPLVEHGLEFLWYQETDGYGSFNATFEQLFNNDGRPNRDSQGERFQLENRDFVINENYAADTRLGHHPLAFSFVPSLGPLWRRHCWPKSIPQAMAFSQDVLLTCSRL